MNEQPNTDAGEDASGETSKDTANSGGIARAIISTVIGLALLVFGLAAVMPDESQPNGSMLALGALFAALGAGILASVLLPHKIQVGGEKVQPLGLDVKASGGAAVFIVALCFIYFSNAQSIEASKVRDAEATPSVAQTQQTPSDGTVAQEQPGTGETPDNQTQAPSGQTDLAVNEGEYASDWTDMEEDIPLSVQPPVGAVYVPSPGYLNNPYNESYSLAPGLVKVRTYCSSCCPAGPQMCAQAGGAASFDLLEATQGAIDLCIQRAGNPAMCSANTEAF